MLGDRVQSRRNFTWRNLFKLGQELRPALQELRVKLGYFGDFAWLGENWDAMPYDPGVFLQQFNAFRTNQKVVVELLKFLAGQRPGAVQCAKLPKPVMTIVVPKF
ncbi:MAG TPA: hypothetical protein VE135_16120 [Pyrinomonadaceae bacterium]|nr:hypothetical protein [Pyrinomonadaceae bacterium]